MRSRQATSAKQNILIFLAIKSILDTAINAVELDVPGDGGMLADADIRLSATIDLYNIRLEELQEKRNSWELGETRLEKALKMLPAINTEKLKSCPDSLRQLKGEILKDARGEEWLWTKMLSLTLAFFTYRPFCHLICPFGFVSWIAEQVSLTRVKVDHEKCTDCGLCIKACPTQAAKDRVLNKLFGADCFSCARCLNVCPQDAIRYDSVFSISSCEKLQKQFASEKDSA